MPVLTPNKAIDSGAPVLLVENRLAAGQHRFSLVVIDSLGRISDADELVVTVRALRIPIPTPLPTPLPTPTPRIRRVRPTP